MNKWYSAYLCTPQPGLRVCPLSSIYWLVNEKLLIIEIEKRHNKMVDRIRYPTVSYLPFYYVFFLLLTIFHLQANILTTKDILSNLAPQKQVSHHLASLRGPVCTKAFLQRTQAKPWVILQHLLAIVQQLTATSSPVPFIARTWLKVWSRHLPGDDSWWNIQGGWK